MNTNSGKRLAWIDYSGWHGHVRARPDGVVMRCGGVGRCSVCKAEQAQVERYRGARPPTPAQAKAGNYRKRVVKWMGLTIKVENEVGSVRCGRGPGGRQWETRMLYPYGYISGSLGTDGDEVDVYLGPNLDTAANVYVVHQRRAGDWARYDEDKCMLGFDSREDAELVFSMHYDDHRFLGDVTEMPVAEFVAKVRTSHGKMLKAVAGPVLLFGLPNA